MNSNLVFNQNNLYTQSGIDNSDNFVYFLYLKNKFISFNLDSSAN